MHTTEISSSPTLEASAPNLPAVVQPEPELEPEVQLEPHPEPPASPPPVQRTRRIAVDLPPPDSAEWETMAMPPAPRNPPKKTPKKTKRPVVG